MADTAGATRRTVVAAAGVSGLAAALAACGSDSDSGSDTANTTPQNSTPAQDTTTPAESQPAEDTGETLASVAEVPEGGGKIFKDQKVVVTQPSAGTFKAFSAVCTHQGCTVGSVENGTINCPCHGSKFGIEDGSVKGGPAQKPLEAKTVTVDNGSLKLT